MEDKNSLEKIAERLKKYAEIRYNLIRLELSDKLISTVTSVSSIIVISLLSIFILLFLSVGVALWITNQSFHASMGFLIIAGFYLLVVFIFMMVKDKIIEAPLVKHILKKMYADETV